DRESKETFKNIRRGLRELRWALEAANEPEPGDETSGPTMDPSAPTNGTPTPPISRAVRHVTVGVCGRGVGDGLLYKYTSTPQVRLRGDWLTEAGLEPGVRLKIHVAHGRLIVEWDDE
ncbi:MAG: type I toxin-antitoxin system SymE family toxin, partial [Planctomycetales bacterium]|nr:type I toxin-antitoxin system SymE family toxin [Planctomycetales bacterium]